jgi:hypothetical protein
MGRHGGKIIGAVAALLALGASILVISPGASGQNPPQLLADVGVVRLHLGTQDYVRFDAANGTGGYTPGTPAPITSSQCVTTVAPGPLAFTPAPSNARLGLVADGLGVKVNSEGNGQRCGLVDGTVQTLTFALAGPVADREIDFAELDIEGKFDAQVRAELWLDQRLVRVEELPTGARSDSGPDSSDNDNYRWRLPSAGSGVVVFDRVVLKNSPIAPGGGFSLEGGADGTAPELFGQQLATTDSLFHLTDVDGILGCGDTATEGGENVPDAGLARGENNLGTPEECVAIPYVLRTGNEGETQFAELLKDLANQAALEPTFTLEIEWEPEPATYPIPRVTEIDYLDGDGPHPIQWCGGIPGDPTLPAGELWCLSGQEGVPAGDGLLVVTERFYGAGDPRFNR